MNFLTQTVDIFGFTFQYWMVFATVFILLGVAYLYSMGKSGGA
ncbi:MAG: hypothetical protein ACRD9W_12425 [Terriglobia bacterium]